VSDNSTRYIALLRGINIGKYKRIKMADLRAMMQNAGFENVKTVLATGNIAFDASSDDTDALQATIAQAIEDTFGFEVPVIVLPRQTVQQFVERDPFQDVTVTDDTRLYVTCLPEPTSVALEMPYPTGTGDFKLVHLSDQFVCGTLTHGVTRSTDAMTMLKKLFGDAITTRNWNTFQKLVDL
jgi:uncharacterized protein (DUF1697 family)